jgi:hypothetical protein
MKFSLQTATLLHLVQKACGPLKSKKAKKLNLKLSACCARVFVHGPVAVAGHEALVFIEGECELPAAMFLELLKSYQDKTSLTLDADLRGLAMGSTVAPFVAYSRHTAPPPHFQVFPVVDLDVAPLDDPRVNFNRYAPLRPSRSPRLNPFVIESFSSLRS